MKKWLWMGLLAGLALAVVACSAPGASQQGNQATLTRALGLDDVQRISPAGAKAMVDEGAALLYDVRSAAEYAAGHAAGAISFPEIEAAERYGDLPANKGLIFY